MGNVTSFAGNGGYVDYSGVSLPTGLTIESDASTFYHYFLMRGLSNLDAKRLANPESVIGSKVRDVQSIQNVVILGPFETQTVFLDSGAPGVITRISVQELAQSIDPTKIGARLTFDGHSSPDIDLTLEGLFLRTGSLTTSLPMPYDSEARFELSNLSGEPVPFILDLERLPGQYPKPYGYLRGTSDFGNIPEGIDFRGRTRVGQGKVVAERYETFVSYALTGTEDFSYWGWRGPHRDSFLLALDAFIRAWGFQ